MRISLNWLKDYVDVALPAAEVAQRLTGVGVVVETLTRPAAAAQGIVVGRIQGLEKHPAADSLLVCQVNCGARGRLQIVTGAPNVSVGDRVPVALPGSTLPTGQRIEAAQLRGVDSAGMLCAPDELVISEGHGGILILPADAAPGADALDLLGLNDAILDLELTANYAAHCQCMVGVAQEYAAITGQAVRWPVVAVTESGTGQIAERVRVRVEAPDLCLRYCGRMIEGVRIGPSPLWLQTRLRAAGMRPINNVVDVTNFVMLELGQPLHAFDFARLAGAEVIARRAGPGERIRTLDGQERELDPDVLVIADQQRCQAIAGVMGGEESEVTADTDTIFLEAALFQNINNRRSARRFGLASEASSRFTKGVDPSGVVRALDRATALLAELTGGRVVPGVIDVYPRPQAPVMTLVRPGRVRMVLGIDMDNETVSRLLARLGFGVARGMDLRADVAPAPIWDLIGQVSPVPADPEVRSRWEAAARERIAAAAQTVAQWDTAAPGTGSAALAVVVPTRRLDVALEVDIIEEVARHHGYDQIQTTLPQGPAVRGGRPRHQEVALDSRRILAGAGLTEVMTYSLTSAKSDDRLRLPPSHPARRHLALQNPMYEERSTLRTLLVPALLEVLQYNVNRQVRDLAVFEIAPVYLPAAGAGTVEGAVSPGGDAAATLPREPLRLAVAGYGNIAGKSWQAPARAADFYWLKGVVAHLFERLGLTDWHLERASCPYLHPGRAAAVFLSVAGAEQEIGLIGELHPEVQAAWDLPGRTYVAELVFLPLAAQAVVLRPYRPVPRQPATARDVSLVIAADIPAALVQETIQRAGGDLVEEVRLFDLYQGPPVPAGQRSLAYSITFRAGDRTLTDAEVDAAHGQVRGALAALGAELRS